MTEYLLRFSWPSKALSSNARVHWGRKAEAKKAYRFEGKIETKNKRVAPMPDAVLWFTFHPPTNRKRDLHNMPSQMKALIDGIADGMGCDDNQFLCKWPDAFSEVVKGGCVLVHIKPKE